MPATAVRVPVVVDMAIKAYDREANAENKHYAGILVISRFYAPSTKGYDNALVKYNDYVDRKEGWK